MSIGIRRIHKPHLKQIFVGGSPLPPTGIKLTIHYLCGVSKKGGVYSSKMEKVGLFWKIQIQNCAKMMQDRQQNVHNWTIWTKNILFLDTLYVPESKLFGPTLAKKFCLAVGLSDAKMLAAVTTHSLDTRVPVWWKSWSRTVSLIATSQGYSFRFSPGFFTPHLPHIPPMSFITKCRMDSWRRLV